MENNITFHDLCYWMSQISFLGAIRIKRICEACQTPERLYNIEGNELASRRLIKASEIPAWEEARVNRTVIMSRYGRLAALDIRFITPFDQDYPSRLRHLPDYPMGLYVKGKLPDEHRPTAAIVGARACTSWGYQEAEVIAAVLAGEGIQIVSGLAAGIDGAGHTGALKADRDTYGILGCGVNICYPPEHYPIYERMAERGGLISEFPLGAAPKRQNFPMRNRLISGLSDVIIVVEARERSGSLITVELGLEQGKEIFAVPGRIGDPLSEGCNQLIQQGANLLKSPSDIIEYFGLIHEKILILHKFDEKTLAKREKMVYSCLDLQPKHFDDIIEASRLAVGECMEILMELEIRGFAVRTAGHYYGKNVMKRS